jgi:hypothetical protein
MGAVACGRPHPPAPIVEVSAVPFSSSPELHAAAIWPPCVRPGLLVGYFIHLLTLAPAHNV